jgi:hydrogenase maturation protease
MRKDVVVIGLGNPLMSDEGIGVELIKRLSESEGRYPGVDFVDGGTGGLSIIHQLHGRRKAVLIDCAYMGAKPGTIKRFTPDDVESKKVLTHRSLHEADLLKVLEMAEELGDAPEEVVILGIEPEVVEPGIQLSKVLSDQIDRYVSIVVKELGT